MKRILPLFLALLLLTACSQRRGVVTVKVIATSDVHGNFFEKDCLSGNEREGSLAKLSTFLKKERNECRNVVFVDCGDILQGSVEDYRDVTAEYYKPSLAAQVYNLLGCDAAAFGNHDIAVCANSYERFFRSADFPVLGSNVYFDEYADYMPPYTIIQRHGVNIGIIGLTTPDVNWTIPSNIIGDLKAHSIQQTATYWVDLLKEKTDVIIALVHSGAQDGELVAGIPGIDVVFYGHDHVLSCTRHGSVPVMNPGPDACNAAVATISVDFSDKDNPSVSVSGEIMDLTGISPDPEFGKALADRYADVIQYADSIIGTAVRPLESGHALWRPASALEYIHSIQMRFFGAQVSLTAPVARAACIDAAPMHIRDVFSLYPYDNNMVSVMMTGDEIRQVLEYSASLFYNTVGKGSDRLLKMRPDGQPENEASRFITACGIDYTIDVTKPEGKRVNVISMSDGKPFSKDDSYRTTINTFLFSGTDSPLYKALDMTAQDMVKRQNSSSLSDMRYYVISSFALQKETGKRVYIPHYQNWKLVPEKIVNSCLANDTLNFKFID